MEYLLVGDSYKMLYVEDDEQLYSLRYDSSNNSWVPAGRKLWEYRVGFDESEPEGSIYRYGNSDCMKEIKTITKEEAEEFIGKSINEETVLKLLKKQ